VTASDAAAQARSSHKFGESDYIAERKYHSADAYFSADIGAPSAEPAATCAPAACRILHARITPWIVWGPQPPPPQPPANNRRRRVYCPHPASRGRLLQQGAARFSTSSTWGRIYKRVCMVTEAVATSGFTELR